MKIKARIKVLEEREFEVSFPAYSAHRMDQSTIYSRLEESGRRVSVHRTGSRSFEFEVGKEDLKRVNEPEYLFGFGEFSSSAEEFNGAMEEMELAIREVLDK